MTTLPSTTARERPVAPVQAPAPPRGPFRLPLIAALALAFASLALISGLAYIVVLAGATGTAERLLVDRAASVVDREVTLVKGRLDPVTEQLELMAALMAAGRIEVDSPVAMREALAVPDGARLPTISVGGFRYARPAAPPRRAPSRQRAITRTDTVSLTELSPRGSSASASCRLRTTPSGATSTGAIR